MAPGILPTVKVHGTWYFANTMRIRNLRKNHAAGRCSATRNRVESVPGLTSTSHLLIPFLHDSVNAFRQSQKSRSRLIVGTAKNAKPQ